MLWINLVSFLLVVCCKLTLSEDQRKIIGHSGVERALKWEYLLQNDNSKQLYLENNKIILARIINRTIFDCLHNSLIWLNNSGDYFPLKETVMALFKCHDNQLRNQLVGLDTEELYFYFKASGQISFDGSNPGLYQFSNGGQDSRKIWWKVAVSDIAGKTYLGLGLSFIKFQLSYSKNCVQQKFKIYDNDSLTHTFCGHREQWKEHLNTVNADFHLVILDDFDPKLALEVHYFIYINTVLKKETSIVSESGENVSVIKDDISGDLPEGFAVWSDVHDTDIGQLMKSWTIQLRTRLHRSFEISVFSETHDKVLMKIFDGPTINSDFEIKQLILQDRITFTSKGFLAFIHMMILDLESDTEITFRTFDADIGQNYTNCIDISDFDGDQDINTRETISFEVVPGDTNIIMCGTNFTTSLDSEHFVSITLTDFQVGSYDLGYCDLGGFGLTEMESGATSEGTTNTVGPFCLRSIDKAGYKKEPFFVSNTQSVRLLIYSYSKQLRMKLTLTVEPINCQGRTLTCPLLDTFENSTTRRIDYPDHKCFRAQHYSIPDPFMTPGKDCKFRVVLPRGLTVATKFFIMDSQYTEDGCKMTKVTYFTPPHYVQAQLTPKKSAPLKYIYFRANDWIIVSYSTDCKDRLWTLYSEAEKCGTYQYRYSLREEPFTLPCGWIDLSAETMSKAEYTIQPKGSDNRNYLFIKIYGNRYWARLPELILYDSYNRVELHREEELPLEGYTIGPNIKLTFTIKKSTHCKNCALRITVFYDTRSYEEQKNIKNDGDGCILKVQRTERRYFAGKMANLSWQEAEEVCQQQDASLISFSNVALYDLFRLASVTEQCANMFADIWSSLTVFVGLNRQKKNNYKWTWNNGKGLTVFEMSHYHTHPIFNYGHRNLHEFGTLLADGDIHWHKAEHGGFCKSIYFHSPHEAFDWSSVGCNHKVSEAAYICERNVKVETQKKPVKLIPDLLFQTEFRIKCTKPFVLIKNLCLMLFTKLDVNSYKGTLNDSAVRTDVFWNNLEPGASVEDFRLFCQDHGGFDVAQLNVSILSTIGDHFLDIWRHDQDKMGQILFINYNTSDCSFVEMVESMSNNTLEIDWIGQNVSCDDIKTGSVLCESVPSPMVQDQCQRNQFKCKSDGSCLTLSKVCDHFNDCQDKSDEENCDVIFDQYCDDIEGNVDGERLIPKPHVYVRCGNGKCMLLSKACSHQCLNESIKHTICPPAPECQSGSQLACQDGSGCFSLAQKCDNVKHCPDASDEISCSDEPIMEIVARGLGQGLGQDLSNYTDGIDDKGSQVTDCGVYGQLQVICSQESTQCFQRDHACVRQRAEYFNLQNDCKDKKHLEDCEGFQCPGMFKCNSGFCVPLNYVCDGIKDCPDREDELICPKMIWKGYLKCGSTQYMHQDDICDGIYHCWDGSDEELCDYPICPDQCKCFPDAILCEDQDLSSIPKIHSKTKVLSLQGNNLSPISLLALWECSDMVFLDLSWNNISHVPPMVPPFTSKLLHLGLRGNNITKLRKNSFIRLVNLRTVDLRDNPISKINKGSFQGMGMLQKLILSEMLLAILPDHAFSGLNSVQMLNLSHNQLEFLSFHTFKGLNALKHLDLRGNPMKFVHPETFQVSSNLYELNSDFFKYCCAAKDVTICTPKPDVFSSCDDLLRNSEIRFFIWLLAIIGTLSNIFVIFWRSRNDEQTPLSFIVQNLGFADFLMGVYLIIIAFADLHYRGVYYLYDEKWRMSILCRIAGFISMLSSEMSVYTLVLVTLEHVLVLGIGLPGFGRRLSRVLIFAGWSVCSIVSVLPITNLPYFGEDAYIQHGVCFLFNLTEGKVSGWEYAAVIFIALNMLALVLLAIGYIGIFIALKIRSKYMDSGNSLKIVRKLALIVMTDCACWIPPITIGIVSLLGKPVDPQFAMWVAICIFPINSSLNPFLYTFSSIKCTDAEAEDGSESDHEDLGEEGQGQSDSRSCSSQNSSKSSRSPKRKQKQPKKKKISNRQKVLKKMKENECEIMEMEAGVSNCNDEQRSDNCPSNSKDFDNCEASISSCNDEQRADSLPSCSNTVQNGEVIVSVSVHVNESKDSKVPDEPKEKNTNSSSRGHTLETEIIIETTGL